MSGMLTICGLPIGNLQDISQRVKDTLSSVDLIAAEDIRDAQLLFSQLGIKQKFISYHDYSDTKKTDEIISKLQDGKNIALVSDAGMPTISDPGYQLIKRAHEDNIKVDVVPGPTALSSALAMSGLPTDSFVFVGFLNRSSGKRQQQLEKIKSEERTLVFYEAPHRIAEVLKEMSDIFGARECFVARELTKKYQEYYRGTISEVLKQIKVKGEFVIVVAGNKEQVTNQNYQKLVEILKAKNISNKDIIDVVSQEYEINKNVLKKDLF